jgi:NMD protein affecting ribosome stability and mRNA decay
MAKQFRGNVEVVDKAIAAAIQALESYREPNPWHAFDQVGYMMRALCRWAREKEREFNREKWDTPMPEEKVQARVRAEARAEARAHTRKEEEAPF